MVGSSSDLRGKHVVNMVAIVMIWPLAVSGAEPRSAREISARWAAYYAAVHHVPVELVDATIDVESGWNPYAVSNKGAVGLMQLMPETAYRFGVRNRFVIEENIRGGVAYLAWLMRLFDGDLRLVTASYYAGERRILSQGLACSLPAVNVYVRQVAAIYRARRLEEVRNETRYRNLHPLGSQCGSSDRAAAHSVKTRDGQSGHRD